jgi:thioredoxin-like negative regulator of GroEL
MVLERLLLIATIAGALWAGARIVASLARWSSETRLRKNPRQFGAGDGSPTLLYFWSEGCFHCRSQETQILEAQQALEIAGSKISVSKHNAVAEKDLSRAMNILTVPSTVLVDGQGRILSWNAGFRDQKALIAQVLHSTSQDTTSLTDQIQALPRKERT